jgi:hypothetical protein
MQDESYMALLDMVALDLPKPEHIKTPLLVLGVGHDNMLTPREIAAMARTYHTQAEIIPDVAHDCMLDPRWQSVAERILAWLKERPAANVFAQAAELEEVTPWPPSMMRPTRGGPAVAATSGRSCRL